MRLPVLVLTLLGVMAGCERESPRAAPAPAAPRSPTHQIMVFAAASTTDVMQEAAKRFVAAGESVKVAFSFDSSSNLAKQIKAGAPADVFISADQKWMDDVASAGEIMPLTRQNLLGNELVVIVPSKSTLHLNMAKDADAAPIAGMKRFAMGDPAHVPAGRYGKQALESLGWWNRIEKSVIPAQDVRAALRLVEMDEADGGIVYATDAKQSQRVSVAGTFPAWTHEPITYPIALTRNGDGAAAKFVESLRSPEMVKVFEQAGFKVLPLASQPSTPSGDKKP